MHKENKNYFFTTLNKAKTSRQKNNLEESKNYFYIAVTIFISLSAITLFYKNRHKIIGFLRKIEKNNKRLSSVKNMPASRI